MSIYVHCAPHTLDLVIVDSAKIDLEVVSFVGVVQKLYTFFRSSNHRWEMPIKVSNPAFASEKSHAKCGISITAVLFQATIKNVQAKNVQAMKTNEFANFIDETRQLAISAQFSEKRKRRNIIFPDKLTKDEPILDKDKAFDVNIYNRMLDRNIVSLLEKFEGLSEVAKSFSFMYYSRFMKLTKSALQKSCEQLTRNDDQYLDSSLFFRAPCSEKHSGR
ncbi:hypothetical protein PR048_023735 [Dryococelus australis]|uniref:Uncharacterized protein n=1 Tax=Dryococelus australis TaxID=614101 RepID=A0ABQ9GV03_9NEOP|nr:hypothetical protein PR048_023735 [Dryococelus australis]